MKFYHSLSILIACGLISGWSFVSIQAQTIVEQLYGNPSCTEEGFSLTAIDSSGFVMSGNSFCGGTNTGYVIKIDLNGDTVWTRKTVEPNGMVRQFQPGVLNFLGKEEIGFDGDTLRMVTTDHLGNPVSTERFFFPECNNFGTDFIALQNGGFASTGFYSTSTCNFPVYDGFLAKHDGGGEILWSKHFGGLQNEEFFDVEEMSDGGFVLFGWTSSRGAGNADWYLVRTNTNGDTLWTRTYGDLADNYGIGMAVTSDGGFLLSGYEQSSVISKTDARGEVEWTKTFQNSCAGTYFRCAETLDTSFVLLSYEQDTSGNCGTVFRKFNLAGNLLWEKHWEGHLREFTEFEPGKFALVGSRSTSVFNTDVLFVRFDTTHFPVPATNVESIQAKSFEIFPNPATSSIIVNLKNHPSAKLQLHDISGKTVLTRKLQEQSSQVNLKKLKPGFYFVELETQEGIWIEKLIVQ